MFLNIFRIHGTKQGEDYQYGGGHIKIGDEEKEYCYYNFQNKIILATEIIKFIEFNEKEYYQYCDMELVGGHRLKFICWIKATKELVLLGPMMLHKEKEVAFSGYITEYNKGYVYKFDEKQHEDEGNLKLNFDILKDLGLHDLMLESNTEEIMKIMKFILEQGK